VLGESSLLADGLPGTTAAEAVQHGVSRTNDTRTEAMNPEISQTARPSAWQYSLRSLLLFTAAMAGMLSAMKTLGFRLWPTHVLFFVALLLPVWFPLFFLPAGSLWQRLRPLLALVPASLYLLLFVPAWQTYDPGLVFVGAGYCLAAVGLAFSARGRRHLINVPLWLALLASAWAILNG
jgi:hypothetical protein